MSKELLYTAISRGTRYEYVNIVERQPRYRPVTRPISMQVKSKPPVLLSARIYEIRFHDDSRYIGQTCKSLEERFDEHKKNPTNAVVAQLLQEGEATIRELLAFKYRMSVSVKEEGSDEQQDMQEVYLGVLNVEEQFIQRALKAGVTLRNDKHCARIIAAKPAKKDCKNECRENQDHA